MMKNIFSILIRRRHYWRHASYSEIAELYVSRSLRIIGINIAAGFTSIYLYQLGYSLITISLLWAFYFVLKIIALRLAASYAAYFGPKHGILVSNMLYVPAMLAISFVEDFGIGAILVWVVSLALSTALYGLSYNIDFSKIKSLEHAGKEIGFMNIFEKLAVGLSPIVGGLVALLFGPRTVMLVGALVFLISAVPLFKTGEQVGLRQKLNFTGFPWRATIRSLLSGVGVGFDYVATTFAWILFIAIVIFTGFGNEIYLLIGALASITVLVAVFTSYIYGRLIDKSRGGELLKYSVVLNSLIHVSRIFVANPAAVVSTNVVNEISTSGVKMPYLRGIFDTADISGSRTIYLSLVDMFSAVGASIAYIFLAICVAFMGDADGLRAFFGIAAIGSLIMGTAKFRLFRK